MSTGLITFSGLPGTGKTTLARHVGPALRAVHLRIDSIEAALKRSVLQIHPAEDAGYLAAAAIAEDNLRMGRLVIIDCVNPDKESRALWSDVAKRLERPELTIEIVCSDTAEHRRRIEARQPDLPGQEVPDWAAVKARRYAARKDAALQIDTAGLPLLRASEMVLRAVRRHFPEA